MPLPYPGGASLVRQAVQRWLTGAPLGAHLGAVSEIVILRAAQPSLELIAQFVEAISRGADVDLVVEGRRSALLPGISKRITSGGRGSKAALAAGMPLFPSVMLLLLQVRQMGHTWTVRKVQGAREVVVEIRRPTGR